MSLDRKIKSKWFKIANILLAVLIIAVFNIDSIITFFGGDFNEKTKLYIIDHTNMSYDILKELIQEKKLVMNLYYRIKPMKKK